MRDVQFAGRIVTREEVEQAIRQFDSRYRDTNDYEGWLDNPAYRYAIEFRGKLYPPKRVMSMASGVDVSRFNGGSQTNIPLERLGFTIIDKQS